MKKAILIFLSIIFIWLGGFLYFFYTIPNTSNNNRSMTESIVVFGENQQNLHIAVQLLKTGYAPIAFIAEKQEREVEHREFLQSQNLAPEQFVFDLSQNGIQYNHAINTIMFMQKYDFHSFRLIVNSYQLPRALSELSAITPADIIIIPHPIIPKENHYSLAFKEYVKYTFFLIGSFIGKENELNLSYS